MSISERRLIACLSELLTPPLSDRDVIYISSLYNKFLSAVAYPLPNCAELCGCLASLIPE